MREVGEPGGAEDHRQAERGHREQHREDDAADRELERLGGLARAGGAGGADRERDGLVAVEVDRDVRSVTSGFGVLGERVLVELDGEVLAEVVDGRARAGRSRTCRRHADVAVADDLAGVVLDGDRDALDRGLR